MPNLTQKSDKGLKQTLDKMLDKGVVVDARAYIALENVDLLEINALMILSSFKTAGKIGMDFPKGTNLNTQAWKDLISKVPCPLCGRESIEENLKKEGCPWCGWNFRHKKEKFHHRGTEDTEKKSHTL